MSIRIQDEEIPSIKIGDFEIFNHNRFGNEAIGVVMSSGDLAGLIINLPPKQVEQMFKFLYDSHMNEEKFLVSS